LPGAIQAVKIIVKKKKMSLPGKIAYLSVADYLEREKDSVTRHEYIDGQTYAMAGASDRHNRIAGNLYNRLDDGLGDGPCEPFISDMKVWVSETVFYYPDVVVACDGPGADAYYRRQPRLIIEVSSPGTERIDRSEKLLAYKQVKSLREYVIVSQDRIHIEIFRRKKGNRWHWEILTEPDDELHLESVGLTLTAAQVYRRVRLPHRVRRK
jgi:Uma2 family endonuclease